jgi:hypothetical protein
MSIFRLLPLSLVIAACAGTLTAQSVPERTPAISQSSDSGQLRTAADSDLLSLHPILESDSPNALDRIVGEDYSIRPTQFSIPRKFITNMDSPQADAVCLKMRVYKVARDGPNTDSIHPAGYTTCSPAARFVTHTIDGVIRPSLP